MQPLDGARNWLIADIGGTNARVARWSAAQGIDARRDLRNDDYATLRDLLAAAFDALAQPADCALLALAMPVTGARLVFTNRDWSTTATELARGLRLRQLVIVNDFVAAAAGVAALGPEGLVPLRTGRAAGGARVVLGPGTGLGVAALVADGARQRVLESEAGHMALAAMDEESWDLVRAAQRQWGRASWERVLCGSGLAWLDAYARGAPPDAPAAVAARAAAGDAAARAAVRSFSRLLGAFAGDVCLAFRATGGVCLTGGVLDGLGGAFDTGAFHDAFIDKGRFRGLLQDVPCWRVAVRDPALPGLAAIARGLAAAPGLFIEGGQA